MAVLNRLQGFLFLAEPYSASRTIRDLLMQLPGSEQAGWHHAGINELIMRYRKITQQDVDELKIISVIRHPFDYLATQYGHMTSWHYGGFDRFVRCELNDKTTIYRHAADANVHIRFDALHEGVEEHFGIAGELPNKYRTVKKHGPLSLDIQKFIVSKLSDFEVYGWHRGDLD